MSDYKQSLLGLKPKITKVELEGYDNEFFIRVLDGKQIEQLKSELDQDEEQLAYKQFCFGLCDEDGNPVFDFYEDKEEYMSLPFDIILGVGQAISLNCLPSKRVEDAKKN